MSLRKFQRCRPDELPEAAGILAAYCPIQGDRLRLLYAERAQNIRFLAAKQSLAAAARCDGYLEYMVALSDDPLEQQTLLLEVQKHGSADK